MPAAKMSTPNFGEAVKKFSDAGISPQFLIPVMPPGAVISRSSAVEDGVRGKVPGRYVGDGVWGGLGRDILTRAATREEFARFSKWPTANVGLMGRAYPGIDSDAESAEMADVVFASIREAFGTLNPAVRIRGKNHRRVYAFKARDWKNDPIRTRRITATLGGVESGLDIQGDGTQYLINGTHPSGDEYEWQKGDELYTKAVVGDLHEYPIDNADIDRFLDVFERNLKKAGGILTSRNSNVKGAEYDPSNSDPSFPVARIFDGLARLPNTADNFPHREDLISAVAGIRAAAGRDGTSQDFEDRVREWAVGSSDGWCTDEYFDKVWDSLRRVRVSRNALDGLFRRNKIFINAADNFDSRTPAELSAEVAEHKGEAKKARGSILDKFCANYVIGDVNTRDEKGSPDMRSSWDPAVSWHALDWWDGNTAQPDIDLVTDLNAEYGVKKPGFWKFMRALKSKHPDRFFIGETRNPNYDFGEIVPEHNPDTDRTANLLNMRAQSAVIRAAGEKDKDPARSARDVQSFLEFGKRIFGKMWAYELATLAFMAQTKKRPGHMLFLVGDSGVGKSTYIQFLSKIFNGSETAGVVDGAKLTTEGSARFAFAGVEGCRIISIRELPKGGRRNATMLQQVTSTIKQMVDAGPEGDFIQIEGKGKDITLVRNFARVVASSNHTDAVEIEEGDRRIFMVHSGININNKPDEDYYENLIAIINDVDRLAGLYRYFLTIDLGDYNANTPPPVSTAKAEQQVMRTTNDIERHMRAALAWFEASERKAFDSRELAEVMRDCSRNEANNLGNGDKEIDYPAMLKAPSIAERGKFSRGIQRIGKFCTLLDPSRTSKDRDPAAYVLRGEPELIVKLNEMERADRLDFLDDEYDRGLCDEHPWAQFREGGK
jgi:energy-coupling factor transporter ATP-binding protein EcfA2